MSCTSPVKLKDSEHTFPCGGCITCRMNYVKQWTIRCLMEAKNHMDTTFVTLSYNEENYPKNGSVSKRELQLFFKRLRKRVNKTIRYFACGEYGEKTGRAHYHAIIFGMGQRETKTILEIWGKGFIKCGTSTAKSIAYTAGYIMKKIKGKEGKDIYKKNNLEPPFTLVSRRPGIGYYEIMNRKEELKNKDFVISEGKKFYHARYIKDKIFNEEEKITNREKWKKTIEENNKIIYKKLGIENDILKQIKYEKEKNKQKDMNLKVKIEKNKKNTTF